MLAETRSACGPPKRAGASRGCAALCGSGAEDDGLERGANTLGWSTVVYLQSGVDVDFEGTAERRNGCGVMHAHARRGSSGASLGRDGARTAAYLHCPPTVLVEEAATLGASRKVGTGRRHILGRRRITGCVRERCTP